MESSSKLTPQEAFAGILMGASGCDGHIAEDEVTGLITCLVRMKLYQRYDGRQFGKTLNKLHGLMKKKGVEALIDACTETLPQDLKRAAFANACDIVLADGVVENDEKIFMERLRDKLQIDPKVAKTIAEVMVIKNKG
ncbi:tellurite resistance TerB family protein [Blastopirellula sp. JC732]|uniref:Tellurite resistance TerB family protein n=1 Tax=Blastopirellula sediminis TaxID=2894196 RepID=A0A9X1MK92_9BACT|nr:tellurite resistance TerB family protein [Blastopirellula sediminis]MCC9607735.1 tellurite resistance TerB family protein [Blastopirellula sediminis]MCC9627472.1 tellurite resistance TerB family protein [Blastopirellula sediminis]